MDITINKNKTETFLTWILNNIYLAKHNLWRVAAIWLSLGLGMFIWCQY